MASDDKNHIIDSKPIYAATEYLLDRAKALGADEADCSCALSQNLDVSVRNQSLENVERSESVSAGLRIIIGKCQAGATTSSFSKEALDELAQRVVQMARLATDDEFCGLAEKAHLCTEPANLELADKSIPDINWLEEQAIICEDASLNVEKVSTMANCGASWAYNHIVYGASNGFLGGFDATTWGLYAVPMAQDGESRERDFEITYSRFKNLLKDAAEIGKAAGERAARRLNPTKIPSSNLPVVIEARVAKSILGMMIGAISGASVARGISFLKDKLGQQIFNSEVVITDNPLKIGGFGSRPFDGEGVLGKSLNIVDNGVLTTWLLNTSSARQLNLQTTGHAGFAQGSAPGTSTSNFVINPVNRTREELIKMANNGLFVTEAMSPYFNSNNGDYSVGITGYMIENGELTFPVSEVTIAGNIIDIYKSILLANDLENKGAMDCPSILIENMTIAGA